MADVTISEALWNDFVALAQRRRPESLAESVLRAYLQRSVDETLIEETARAARRAKFRIDDTEELIRQYRHKKPRLV
jgi:hypothetical protein